jgi:hypothetical protein
MRVRTTVLALTIACAACTGRDATPDATGAATASAPPSAPTIATPPSSPMTTTAPASTVAAPSSVASPSTVAPPSAAGPLPAEGAITFLGFGPAHWGASEEQVRQAWGRPLEGAPAEPGGCHYLFPEPRSAGGYRLAYMIEADRFVRLDVRAPDIAAPGGGRVGIDKAQLLRLYPKVVEQPHKYLEGGLNLRVADPAGGQGVAVFEVDPSGDVTAWRLGVPPQVDYVEGCS